MKIAPLVLAHDDETDCYNIKSLFGEEHDVQWPNQWLPRKHVSESTSFLSSECQSSDATKTAAPSRPDLAVGMSEFRCDKDSRTVQKYVFET